LIRVDFHNHTTFSSDSRTTPKAFVESLVNHPTVKAAAVTDHDTVKGLSSVLQLAKAYSDILIIPGVEITTFQGDVIVLGTEELPPKPWIAAGIVDFAKKTGCVTIAVHPFREFGLGESAADIGVDAVEVFNGASSAEANRQARELARETGLPGVAGSDSHRPEELFCVHTDVQSELDLDEILKAIREGAVSVSVTGRSIRF
jgi:predicted metal-dependent phosphoesterase TrpH